MDDGRVYDPLLARFGTPGPMTEDPYSTQGWNRYSYVGNSPVNFTDPSGYCFMGCFWKPMFAAVGRFLQRFWGAILQTVAPALICGPAAPVCAAVVGAITTTFVVGVTSGNLGLALRAGITAFITSMITQSVLESFTPRYAANPIAAGPSYAEPPSGVGAGGGGGMFGALRSLGSETGSLVHQAQTELPPLSVQAATVESNAVRIGKGVLNAVPGYEFSAIATKSFRAGDYIAAAAATAVAGVDILSGGSVSTASRGVRWAKGFVAARVDELRSVIPSAQRGRITMGVGLAEDANGVCHVLVGTSEPGGYLRPGVTLREGEIMVPGTLHAEENILLFAQNNQLRLLEVGATRPICPLCAGSILDAGAKTVTPLKIPTLK